MVIWSLLREAMPSCWPQEEAVMRSLQLLTLALLAAAAARADTFTTCSNSITGNLADGTPYSATSDGGMYVESAFAECGGNFDNGLLTLVVSAGGSGPDNGPILFGRASGTLNFADQITFFNNHGTTGTVAWSFQTQ